MPSHRAEVSALRRPRKNKNRRAGFGWLSSGLPGGSLSAPKVGIAGALGIATIAAPISGAMANPVPKVQVNRIQAAQAMPVVAFPALPDSTGNGVELVQVIPSTQVNGLAPALLAAPRTIVVSRASRSGERSVLPGCDGVVRASNAPNGELSSAVLCTLWDPTQRLRADAAVALAKLNVSYKQHFGKDVCVTDSYRTLAVQERLRATKPGLAAVAGTSEHGWGLAVDLCDGVENGTGSRFTWLRDNAAAYGWENPAWAHIGGGGPYEPWHWEYVVGETGPAADR